MKSPNDAKYTKLRQWAISTSQWLVSPKKEKIMQWSWLGSPRNVFGAFRRQSCAWNDPSVIQVRWEYVSDCIQAQSPVVFSVALEAGKSSIFLHNSWSNFAGF
jgi:hypothetical protein